MDKVNELTAYSPNWSKENEIISPKIKGLCSNEIGDIEDFEHDRDTPGLQKIMHTNKRQIQETETKKSLDDRKK